MHKFTIGCQENFKTGSAKRNIRSLKMNKWSCFFSIKAMVKKKMREVIYSLYVREKTQKYSRNRELIFRMSATLEISFKS
jgi:hypothetical protein